MKISVGDKFDLERNANKFIVKQIKAIAIFQWVLIFIRMIY